MPAGDRFEPSWHLHPVYHGSICPELRIPAETRRSLPALEMRSGPREGEAADSSAGWHQNVLKCVGRANARRDGVGQRGSMSLGSVSLYHCFNWRRFYLVDRKDRRDKSYFRRGWDWVERGQVKTWIGIR
jgi:hypothetical protein